MTPKTFKNQKIKKIKNFYKETSNQKSSENKLQLELKNINNSIFGSSQSIKLSPNKQNKLKIQTNQKLIYGGLK